MKNIVSTEDASELLENKEGFVILVYDAKDEEGDGQGGAGNMRALYDLCETIAEEVQAKELRQIDFLSCPEVYDHCRNWFKEKVSKTLPHQLPVVVYGDGDYLGFFNSAKIDDCFDEFEETEIDIDLPFPLEHAKQDSKLELILGFVIIISTIVALWLFVSWLFSGSEEADEVSTLSPAEIAAQQAEAERLEREKEELCRADVLCWSKRYIGSATVRCQPRIEAQAKYEYEWTDGFLDSKFTRFAWVDEDQGTVMYLGDSLKLQNAFGTFSQHRYGCNFDTLNEEVISVTIEQGRF